MAYERGRRIPVDLHIASGIGADEPRYSISTVNVYTYVSLGAFIVFRLSYGPTK